MATPLSDLGKDIERIDEAMAGALTRFGKMGTAGQKGWTAFARITSGTLVWRLQARLRSVMNIVEIMTDRQAAYNIELADSFKKMGELKDATKNIRKFAEQFDEVQELFVNNLANSKDVMDALSGNEIFDGLMYKYENNIGKVLEKGKEFLTDQTARAEKAMAMDKAGGFLRYYAKHAIPNMKEILKNSGFDQKSLSAGLREEGGYFGGKSGFAKTFRNTGLMKYLMTKEFDGGPRGRTRLEKGLFSKDNFLVKAVQGYIKFASKVGKFVLGGLKMLPRLIGMALGALMTAMLYGTAVLVGLLVVIAIIRKAWPLMKKQMKVINKFAGITRAFFWGVSRILEGLMMVLSGLWEGDLIKVLKGLWLYVLPGILAVGYSIVAGIASLLVTLATSVIAGIVTGLAHVLGQLPLIGKYIPQYAKGGVSKGGLAIVGEEGPELVSLPRGARVHPNGHGPSGSTVINVNVTGRVGASDAEIRDIANKVAREINLRMNTRGTITMGG